MAKKATAENAVEVAGSALGKNLQEKQIDKLEKARLALEGTIDGYRDTIVKLNEELVETYYKIQEKEEELKSLESIHTKDRLEKVATLEANIKSLEKEFKTKEADYQVNFDLLVKANKEKVMADLMATAGLATITKQDLAILSSKLNKAEDALAKGFEEEVTKMRVTLQKEYDTEVEKLNLTHSKEQSTNAAKIEQMLVQIEFLEKQLDKAEKRVVDILDNQVKIAQADKGVVVNTYDKK